MTCDTITFRRLIACRRSRFGRSLRALFAMNRTTNVPTRTHVTGTPSTGTGGTDDAFTANGMPAMTKDVTATIPDSVASQMFREAIPVTDRPNLTIAPQSLIHKLSWP